jgi:hypothetical protein
MKKSAVKITKVESDGDKKPAAAAAASTNVEVDIIDGFMIISSPLEDQVQPNLSTPKKAVQKKQI